MYVKTTTRTEKQLKKVCVGVMGYDDPVYEDRNVDVTVTERELCFDDPLERKAHWKYLCKIKPKLIRIHNKMFDDIIQKANEEYDEYENRIKAYNRMSFIRKMFTVEPDELRDNQYNRITSREHLHERRLAEHKDFVTLNEAIKNIPSVYTLFLGMTVEQHELLLSLQVDEVDTIADTFELAPEPTASIDASTKSYVDNHATWMSQGY